MTPFFYSPIGPWSIDDFKSFTYKSLLLYGIKSTAGILRKSKILIFLSIKNRVSGKTLDSSSGR